MKILLLIPPSKFSDNIVRDVLYGCWCKGNRIGGGTVPPLNLLTIATILKQDDNQAIFLDALNEKVDFSTMGKIAMDCDIVILLTSTMSIREDIIALRFLKDNNKNIKSIIFGSHPTFMTEFCLDNNIIDVAVRKEPDFSIRDLVRAFKKKDDLWKSTPGIAYKEKDGIKINPDYPLIDDIDKIPIADRNLLPKGIRYFNPLIKNYPYTTTVTSRGCPGRCTFCTIPYFYGGEIRSWSAIRIIEEIRYLISLGYKEIYYRDETFTFNKTRTFEICEQILIKNLKFSWLCNVRIGTVDKETLLLMKNAGCRLIKIGVESGTQKILDNSKKGINLKQTVELFMWAKELDLSTHAHLMLGMPDEDKDSLKTTLNFIKKINPDTIDVGICTPYPGSELFDKLLSEHPELDIENITDFSNLHTRGFYNRYFTELDERELERGLSAAYRSFYLRPSYFLNRLCKISSLSEFKDLAISGIKIINFSLFGE